MTEYERLLILRQITKLDLVSTIKIYNLCKKAQSERDALALCDSTHNYSVDYSAANELEYIFRMKALREKLRSAYERYISIENDGALLEDFVEDYINRHAYLLDKGKTI
jgi:hypothetical protein